MVFGTKAETLERLKGCVQVSNILDLYYFRVADWHANRQDILATCRSRFEGHLLAVRSSAFNEDGAHRSMAGAYTSRLNVDSQIPEELEAAIEEVVASYAGNPLDQVLVQRMLTDVALSGVLMTHALDSGAPYYVLNYDDESGQTDRITGGVGVNKTVLVYRKCPIEYIESPRIAELIRMAQELEQICGGHEPLDIEFAKTSDGTLYLLQLRRITVQKNWNRGVEGRVAEAIRTLERFVAERGAPRPGLLGSRTILGQMPDWNPAEIIGTDPRPLAVSLYRTLVTDALWAEARALMGYRKVANEELMVLLAGRPYIDVRNSFNSFLPAGLNDSIGRALIDAWLQRLDEHPELHDKVEFQVAQTILDFGFQDQFAQRYQGVLDADQLADFEARLRELTRRNVSLADDSTLRQALGWISELETLQQTRDAHVAPLWRVRRLLNECRTYGTLPFAIIARHAFIAETLLRSAVTRGALSAVRLEQFKRSLVTVTGDLTRDFERVLSGSMSKDDFLVRYGHLRPGTYDILSLRYDQREDLLRDCQLPQSHDKGHGFALEDDERRALQILLTEAGLDGITPDGLIAYADVAIVNREYSKFVFTRHLSDALEAIAEWGEELGLSRDDLSYLSMEELLDTFTSPILGDVEAQLRTQIDRRKHVSRWTRSLCLGYLVRGVRDLYVAPQHRSAPNFVTSESLEGPVVLLDSRTTGQVELFRKIVCIENADPGFDWIFTRGISGLISKFGGANSHMTIRCAELGIPAAIGVGEQTFENLVGTGQVELNCAARVVRPVFG